MIYMLFVIAAGFISTTDGFSAGGCQTAKQQIEASVTYPITVLCIRKI